MWIKSWRVGFVRLTKWRFRNPRHRNLLIGTSFLISSTWIAYIGRYKTLYGAGIMLTPLVLVFALLPFFASAFLFNKSWAYSARVFLVSCSILFTGLITGYYIDEYKPTVYVKIPHDYQGCIYLFNVDTESLKDIEISEHGIGYIPYGGHYHLGIKMDGKKQTDILNSSNYNQIQFFNSDSTKVHWVDVSCLEIDPLIDYSQHQYVPREYLPCMGGRELRMLMNLNQIDSSIIKWQFYNY